MPQTAVANGSGKRGAALRTALVLSLIAHVALLVWIYKATPPLVRQAAIERIIPVFVTPRHVVRPPPPPVVDPPQRAADKPRLDPGGRSGQGSDTPAVPVRQPERIFEPERVINVPPVRNPDPAAPTIVASTGNGVVQGQGAGNQPGSGQGVGTGSGPGTGTGTGPGSAPGGVPRAPAGWVPEWRQLPTREQANGVYPKAAWDKGISGGATLLCTLGVNGRVRDCEVIREAPPGQGFGRAVLMLSRHFRITPRRENGRAVETRLAIPYMLLMDPNQTPRRRNDGSLSTTGVQPGPIEAPVIRK